jgi:thioredoxin reductase
MMRERIDVMTGQHASAGGYPGDSGRDGYDAIVVGGSFAGMSGAMQLARARRRILLVDAGRPRNRFVASSHGFLGQDGKSPREIIGLARHQLAAYPTVEFFAGEAVEARKHLAHFELGLSDGQTVKASRLLLATGVRDELPLIGGIEERWGVTVFQCPYCHGFEVAGRQLGVIGNHPMSAHQASIVSDWGPTTYFTQGIFEPDAEQLAMMHVRDIRIERAPAVEILGSGASIDAVRLSDGRAVTVQTVFTAPRTHMASGLAGELGCGFDDGPFGPLIRTDERKQTTIAGVYAAGDATSAMANATLASAAGVMAGVGALQSLILEQAARQRNDRMPIDPETRHAS